MDFQEATWCCFFASKTTDKFSPVIGDQLRKNVNRLLIIGYDNNNYKSILGLFIALFTKSTSVAWGEQA